MNTLNEENTFIYDLESIFLENEDVRDWTFNAKSMGLTWDYLDRLEYFKSALASRHFQIRKVGESFELAIEIELSNTTVFLKKLTAYKGSMKKLGVSYELVSKAQRVLENLENAEQIELGAIHRQIDDIASHIVFHMRKGIYENVESELERESLLSFFIMEYQSNNHFRELVTQTVQRT